MLQILNKNFCVEQLCTILENSVTNAGRHRTCRKLEYALLCVP